MVNIDLKILFLIVLPPYQGLKCCRTMVCSFKTHLGVAHTCAPIR